MNYTILSTKKLLQSLQQQLKLNGFELLEEEFIYVNNNITSKTAEQIKNIYETDVLIFTSANAVETVKRYIDVNARFRIFCISGKTKEIVEAVFPNAIIVDVSDYGNELAEKIIAAKVQNAVFFCGNIRRDELPSMLHQNNIPVTEIVVYQTIETPKPVNQHFDAILFFSPSAVKSFFSLNQLKHHVVCFSIGTTTAATIKEYAGNKIIIADFPSQEQIVIRLKQYFSQQVQC